MRFKPKNSFNVENLEKDYKSLKILKDFLGVKGENVTRDYLNDTCSKHNMQEVYLLTYIIDCIFNLPEEIKQQFKLLNLKIDNPQEYEQLIAETNELYQENPVFIKHYRTINYELEFEDEQSTKFFNQVIFEFFPEHLKVNLHLNKTNVLINIHLVQKWLYEQDYKCLKNLNSEEIKLLKTIINRGDFSDLYKETKSFSNIKAKLKVKSTLQSIAMFYYNSLF